MSSSSWLPLLVREGLKSWWQLSSDSFCITIWTSGKSKKLWERVCQQLCWQPGYNTKPLKTEPNFEQINGSGITYVFGRNGEATFLSRNLVCKAFSQSINAFNNGEWSHTDLWRQEIVFTIQNDGFPGSKIKKIAGINFNKWICPCCVKASDE